MGGRRGRREQGREREKRLRIVKRNNGIYFEMTTLYLPTPGLFVDKPFCHNLLVKEREARVTGYIRP